MEALSKSVAELQTYLSSLPTSSQLANKKIIVGVALDLADGRTWCSNLLDLLALQLFSYDRPFLRPVPFDKLTEVFVLLRQPDQL